MSSESLDKIMPALTFAQLAIGGVKKGKINPHFKNKYADLNAILDAVRVPLSENDLHLSQPITTLDDGRMSVTTILYHSSGQSLTSSMILPSNDKPQQIGSAISYWRRYQLMSLLALPADDDDGNQAQRAAEIDESMRDRITQEEAAAFSEDLDKVPDHRDKLLAFMKQSLGITSLSAIKRPTYDKWRKRLDEELAKLEGDECEQ